MPHVAEIAPDIYRICVFYPELNLQFNHFLVKDEEPLLFHTGLRRMFPEVREGVAKVLDPAHLRWISWSHFESDECGSLNEWLTIAPHAQPACGMVGALVNVNDFSSREARILAPQDVLTTGKYRFRYYNTPQLPHGWDAGVMFEEIERVRKSLTTIQASPLANYVPYTHNTGRILEGLASLKPQTLATMHGSSFCGDGQEALLDLATVMKEVLDKPSYNFAEVQQAVGP